MRQPIIVLVCIALILSTLGISARVSHAAAPSDPRYAEQWGLGAIHAPAAWDVTTGSSQVVIAVIDSGVEIAHPDLAGQIWTNPGEIAGNGIDDDGNGYIDDIHGWNLIDNSADISDSTGHGTQVAGVIAAAANNGEGGAGVCAGCKLMVVKVTHQSGSANYSDIAAGVRYAAAKGAQVINISLGGGSDSVALRDAVAAAAPGAVIVAGAGNNASSALFYPAAYGDHVLAVAGIGETNTRVASSNYGPWIDVVAPGENVLTTASGGGYVPATGTSVGAPFASGLAGLLLSTYPAWSPADVRAQIIRTAASANIDAANPGYVGKLGGGIIDAGAALNTAAQPDLKVVGVLVNGQAGGRPEPGTEADVLVTLGNNWGTATNVQGTLSSGTPATISQASVSFGTLPALGSATATVALHISVPVSADYNQTLSFNLHLTADGGYSTDLAVIITTAPGVTNAPATISGSVVWTSDRLYLVNGDIGIAAGSTLTIQPGTVVKIKPTANIIVQGKLIADGTAERPITFTAQDATKGWGQIQFQDSSADASFAGAGAYIGGSILRHAVVEYGQVSSTLAAPYIVASRFVGRADSAVMTPGMGTNLAGISANPSGSMRIEDNDLRDASISLSSGWAMVTGASGEIRVTGNSLLRGNIAVSSGNVSSVVIRDNTISGEISSSAYGISASGSVTTTISMNRVYGAGGVGTGITLGGGMMMSSLSGPVLIERNLVSATGIGIQIPIGASASLTASLVLRENTLANIKDSVIATTSTGVTGFTLMTPQITNNNLLPATAATGYTMRMCDSSSTMPGGSKCTSAVDARGNWWGTSDPAAISTAIFDGNDQYLLGVVDASAPLDAPVATAPAYVTGVGVSPDSTLGIQTGSFSAHFSRPMDQSQAPAISFSDARRGTSQAFTYNGSSGGAMGMSSGRPAIDSQGRIWTTGGGGLLRFDGSTWTYFPFPQNVAFSISAIAIDSSDQIWGASYGGLISFDGATFSEHRICPVSSDPLVPPTTLPTCTATYSFSLIAIAPDGAVWLGGNNTMPAMPVVARYSGGVWAITTASDLPTGNGIQSLAFGASGDVWVTTNFMGTAPTTNAARFANGAWTTQVIKAPADTSLSFGLSLATDIDGSLWASTSTQLLRYNGSAWVSMATISTSTMPFWGSDSFLAIDRAGVKWVSSSMGRYIRSFDGSSWRTISSEFNASGFVIDADGHKWYRDTMNMSPNLNVIYDGYATPITGGSWADATTYQASYNFTSVVARGSKAISVADAVGTDGISIASDSASSFKVDYAGQISDRTAPHTPTLWSSGVTGDPTGLSIQWGAVDNESSVVAVRYAVGSNSSAQDVLSWTAASLAQTAALATTGGSTGATISRAIPGLTNGQTYYVSLQAQNAGGLWSPSAISTFVAGQTTTRKIYVYLPLLWR